MRGWEYAGRIDDMNDSSWARQFPLCNPTTIVAGDVIAFAHSKDGPLRAGFAQVAHVDDLWLCLKQTIASACPAVAPNDYVFRATALGESAFARQQ